MLLQVLLLATPPAHAAAAAAPPQQQQQKKKEEQPKKKVVEWGQSAVYIKGKWVPFDEDDEAGVPQPYPPKTDSWKSDDTSIMVSISSFRDYRCAKTLYNLFTCVFPPKFPARFWRWVLPCDWHAHLTLSHTPTPKPPSMQQGPQPGPRVRRRGAAEQRRGRGLPLRLLPHDQRREEHRAQGLSACMSCCLGGHACPACIACIGLTD